MSKAKFPATWAASGNHPAPSDIDWALIERLAGDDTLIGQQDIAQWFQVSDIVVWRWVRAGENYTLRGWRQWPPTKQVLQDEVHGDPDAPALTGTPPYPWHPSVLPPPLLPAPGSPGRRQWRRGDIYRWALITGRVTVAGAPIVRPGKAGGRPGRGAVPGRIAVASTDSVE